MATTIGHEIYFVDDDSYYNLRNGDCSWMIDTRTSYHLTSNRDYLTS